MATITVPETLIAPAGVNRWDSPWVNAKFVSGLVMMLAVIITGAPRSFQVGLTAAGIGLGVGILLGFSAGFMRGWVDNVIRTLADSVITIPSLALLILVSSYVRVVDISSMALILALF